MDKTEKSRLETLMLASGYKSQFIADQLGYSVRSTWVRKKTNPDLWTTADVRNLAKLLKITPQEIYEALYFDSQAMPMDQIPE